MSFLKRLRIVGQSNSTGLSKRSDAEIVKEIHDTFFTEVDRLLESAGISTQCDIDEALMKKAHKLSKLRFISTQEVKKNHEQQRKINEVNKENSDKDRLKRAILYFRQKYPLYKFITDESVDRILEKYNLVRGPIDAYIGTVPDKNIQEMEQFKVDLEDVPAQVNLQDHSSFRDQPWGGLDRHYYGDFKEKTPGNLSDRDTVFIPIKQAVSDFIQMEFDAMDPRNKKYKYFSQIRYRYFIIKKWRKIAETGRAYSIFNEGIIYVYSMALPDICAPQTDFDTSRLIKNGARSLINIPDPIVLQPVIFEGEKYNLIQTAWGPEASEPEIVNEKFN